MKNAVFFDSPAGRLCVAESDGFITHVAYHAVSGCVMSETPVLKTAVRQLSEYFKGARREFDIPINPCGTAFQKEAWAALLKIPYGAVRTYKEQAAEMGRGSGFQAVGGANSRNPISIIIPCHRVIGAKGALTGYSGGLAAKRLLLELEADYSGLAADSIKKE